MIPIDWTDPSRESVGEHRARKIKKKDRRTDQPVKSSSSFRSSITNTESPFAFLHPRSFKQSRALKKTPTIKLPDQTVTGVSIRSPSPHASDFAHPKAPTPAALTTASGRHGLRSSNEFFAIDDDDETSPSLTFDSIFSRSPGSDGRTSNSIEALTDDVSKLSIVRLSQQASISEGESPASSLHRKSFSEPLPLLAAAAPTAPQHLYTKSFKNFPSKLPIKVSCAEDEDSNQSAPAANRRYNNIDAWRPTNDWDTASATMKRTASVANYKKHSRSSSLEIASSPEMIRQIITASPGDILKHLGDLWRTSSGIHVDHRSESEKHLWMLCVVQHLDRAPWGQLAPENTTTKTLSRPKSHLCLYDTAATASYIATLYPDHSVFHISDVPLHHKSFPNVHPLSVPQVSSSMFPFPPNKVDRVYSIAIQSVFGNAEIPRMLANVSKCLRPGGVCELTLIDPMPRLATLGRHLQAWLERNLMVNLARQLKCVSPGFAFPEWLGQAGLRAAGSKLTTVKFFAIPESIFEDHDNNADSVTYEQQKLQETKAEVRSLAGRTLWMEVWGPYVTAEKWWWEDPVCVDECLQLGTIWEYHLIEGVKC
ncbi:hypothetical protein S7711_07744 [Stachybotrys chartarum IBT 7711]|uniref:Methyltransferase type 11 domain-containing protein n=1 Tax=Stachybotrys chartarum (strain CBS 109288 / IBT 7711) TaxID=1280523 RepID=A0A084AKW0_STACB|nr:hypothetical protein S7711_07744 [Stachybotrys chartarum IBT 7711]